MRRLRDCLVGAAALGLATTALAQAPAPPTPAPDQNYIAPKIGEAYGKAIAELPDWNGSYATVGGLMFDPSHQVLAPGTDSRRSFSSTERTRHQRC